MEIIKNETHINYTDTLGVTGYSLNHYKLVIDGGKTQIVRIADNKTIRDI